MRNDEFLHMRFGVFTKPKCFLGLAITIVRKYLDISLKFCYG